MPTLSNLSVGHTNSPTYWQSPKMTNSNGATTSSGAADLLRQAMLQRYVSTAIRPCPIGVVCWWCEVMMSSGQVPSLSLPRAWLRQLLAESPAVTVTHCFSMT